MCACRRTGAGGEQWVFCARMRGGRGCSSMGTGWRVTSSECMQPDDAQPAATVIELGNSPEPYCLHLEAYGMAMAGTPCQTPTSWAYRSFADPPKQRMWAILWPHCKACLPARPAKVTSHMSQHAGMAWFRVIGLNRDIRCAFCVAVLRDATASSAEDDLGTLVLRAKRLTFLCMHVLLHRASQPLQAQRTADVSPASGSAPGVPDTAVVTIERLTGAASKSLGKP